MDEAQLFDSLMYSSYYAQRHDYGMSYESAAKIYRDAARYEQQYQDEARRIPVCVTIPTALNMK